jgi:hypothetical protein
MLEFSQYLENYLWPHYEAGKASHAHMMSIVVMINEKFRERVPAWQVMFKNIFNHLTAANLVKTSLNKMKKLVLTKIYRPNLRKVFLRHIY